eukprot:tig00020510_g9930.t1
MLTSATSPELGELSDDILCIIIERAGFYAAWSSLRRCSRRLKALVESIEWTAGGELAISVVRLKQLEWLRSLVEAVPPRPRLVVDRVRKLRLHLRDGFWVPDSSCPPPPQRRRARGGGSGSRSRRGDVDFDAKHVAAAAAFVRAVAERAPSLVEAHVGELWTDSRIVPILDALQPAADRLEAFSLNMFSERPRIGLSNGNEATRAALERLRFPRLQSFSSSFGNSEVLSPWAVGAIFPGLRRVELAVMFNLVDEYLGAFAGCAALENLSLRESVDRGPANDNPVGGYGLRRLAGGPAGSSLRSLRLQNPPSEKYQPVRLAAEAVRALPLFPNLRRLSGPLEIGRTVPRDAIAALATMPSLERAELVFRVGSVGAVGADQLLGLAALVRSSPSLRSLPLLVECDAETQIPALQELADAARGAPALRVAAQLTFRAKPTPRAAGDPLGRRLRQLRASLPPGLELQLEPPAPPALSDCGHYLYYDQPAKRKRDADQ